MAAVDVQALIRTRFFLLHLKMFHTQALHEHNLTLMNFSGTSQSAGCKMLTLKNHQRAAQIRPNNSTFCAPLNMLQKATALMMILFLSASIRTIGVAPGLQLDATRVHNQMLFTFVFQRWLISFLAAKSCLCMQIVCSVSKV